MAASASSHQIILPHSRQIVLVNARPGDRVNDRLVINPSPTQLSMIQSCDDILSAFDDAGPAYTTISMELSTLGSVPTLVPLDGSHVLDHETCIKLASYIAPPVRANDFSKDKIDQRSVEIDGNNVEDEDEEEEVCVICLGELKTAEVVWELECKHRYHEDCIENWLQLKNDCPICRVEV